MVSRRGTEEWSDLQQQRAYLEMRVSNLEEQLTEYKESTHQQRLRALDLKIEMRDVRICYNFFMHISLIKVS